MVQYPLNFYSKAKAGRGIEGLWESRGHEQDQSPIQCAVPKEFQGPGGGYSPEDLYGLALVNCFVATFKVFAERSRLDFETLEVSAHLIVDRDEAGTPWMKKITLEIELQGVPDSQKALRLLDKTSGQCLIHNSVKTERVFIFKVGHSREERTYTAFPLPTK